MVYLRNITEFLFKKKLYLLKDGCTHRALTLNIPFTSKMRSRGSNTLLFEVFSTQQPGPTYPLEAPLEEHLKDSINGTRNPFA